MDLRKKRPFTNHPTHNCSVSYCNPLNESGLIREGFLPPNHTIEYNDMVFVCKYGQLHECGSDCMGQGQTCPVSGASIGYEEDNIRNYDPANPKTWGKDDQLLLENELEDTMTIYSKAERVVDAVLYSSARSKILDQWRKLQVKRVKVDIEAYQKQCTKQKVPVNLIRIAMLECPTSSSIGPLKRDPEKVEYYVEKILKMFHLVRQHPVEKPCITSVAIALLYRMQQGKVVQGITLIPMDPYLAMQLPLMNDLKMVGLDGTLFTKGERMIDCMYEQGRRAGKTWEELVL